MLDKTFKEAIKNIHKGILSPVYFLYGDEPFYIQKIIQATESFIHSSGNEEGLFVYDTKDYKKNKLNDVILLMQEAGMFSSFKLAIFRNAQNLPEFQSSSKAKEIGMNTLMQFINNPVSERHIIFAFEDPEKKIDERKTNIKEIIGHNNVFKYKSEKIKDYRIKDWIKAYITDLGRVISDDAATKLSENIGNDLLRIEKEIGKILINIKPNEEIVGKHVDAHTIINREYNIFELQKALINRKRDVYKANAIIKYFSENKSDYPIERVLYALNDYFVKLLKYHLLTDTSEDNVMKELKLHHRIFIKDYLEAARNYSRQKVKQVLYLIKEYDLKSKKINNHSLESPQLLQELIYKIIH